MAPCSLVTTHIHTNTQALKTFPGFYSKGLQTHTGHEASVLTQKNAPKKHTLFQVGLSTQNWGAVEKMASQKRWNAARLFGCRFLSWISSDRTRRPSRRRVLVRRRRFPAFQEPPRRCYANVNVQNGVWHFSFCLRSYSDFAFGPSGVMSVTWSPAVLCRNNGRFQSQNSKIGDTTAELVGCSSVVQMCALIPLRASRGDASLTFWGSWTALGFSVNSTGYGSCEPVNHHVPKKAKVLKGTVYNSGPQLFPQHGPVHAIRFFLWVGYHWGWRGERLFSRLNTVLKFSALKHLYWK